MASDTVTRHLRAVVVAASFATTLAAAPLAVRAQGGNPVSAADKETARQLMDQGDAAYGSGDLARALDKYRAADDIMGVPTTAFEVGRTYEAMGLLVEARDAYLRAVRFRLDEPNAAFEEAKTKADERAAVLGDRIATLKLTIAGVTDDVSLEILIDGVRVSAAGVGQRSVNPGEHTIVVRAPGYREGRARVSLSEGETTQTEIVLEEDPDALAPAPLPTPDPSPVPTPEPVAIPEQDGAKFPVWATVGFSVGLVGFGVGAAFGILSLSKAGDLEEACSDRGVCEPGIGLEETQDDALLFANISNVGFIVGGVGTAFGIVALFTLDAGDDEATASIAPIAGPGYVGVTGRF